jgi:hypothetical protein
MTWSKSVLPDEALDPDCLVAQLLTEQSGHSKHDLPARAALAQQPVSQPYKLPEPVAPTDEELYELWNSDGNEADFQDCRRFARAVLARWGTPANTINQEDYDRG